MQITNVIVASAIVFTLARTANGEIRQAAEEALRLAIVVHHQPDGRDLSDKLQPLLEAEASIQWAGRLVERAELDKLLQELKISASGLIDPNKGAHIGKMLHFDALLTVETGADSVGATVSLFPSTSVIHERTYAERLEPQPLAVNIMADAVGAILKHNREPNVPQVSIGSFYCPDPHRRFLRFGRDIGIQLRDKLAEDKSLGLTERLLPSDLVSEFELARSGLTESIARNLSAPPSDILLYGEFEAKPKQELPGTAAQLDLALFVTSPTGLCESRGVQLSCSSNEPGVVVAKALQLIEQAAEEVRTGLAAGGKRSFSEHEFLEFKRQAFRLMPRPPLDDGDYYKQGYYRGPIQTGRPEELERALHILECAMLFKGDDTQVLVCLGAVLENLARGNTGLFQPGDGLPIASLQNAAMDLIERAYFLDSNWNTRGMYWRFCVIGGLIPAERRPARSIKAARQVWDSRETEPWHPHEVRSAFSILFELPTDLAEQYRMFLGAASEYERAENGLRDLLNLFDRLTGRIYESGGKPDVIRQGRQIAEKLLAQPSPLLQSLGHLFYLSVCFKMGDSTNLMSNQAQGKERAIPAELAEHFRAAIDMLPRLYQEYGKEFAQCSYSNRLCNFFETYRRVVRAHGLKDDSDDVAEQYVACQMRAGNYTNAGIQSVLRALLPTLWERDRYERACDLTTEFLEHYTVTGSADYDRMWLARQRNRLWFAMQNKPLAGADQLNHVEFDDGREGWVTKLVPTQAGVFGLRSEEWYRTGAAFRLAYAASKASILRQIAGDVRDIACAGKYVGVATWNGFYLLEIPGLDARRFTSGDSGLPSQTVSLVCDGGGNFYVGVPGREYFTYIYYVDPDAVRISRTDTKFSAHNYWRMKCNTAGKGPDVVIPQTWNRRTAVAGGETFEFSCGPARSAVKDVIVCGPGQDHLLTYRGFELSYVFDFTLWQRHLVFATGNGLYTSEPDSNVIHCLISEPDLMFFSLCPLEERMYMGTSNGLYCIEAGQFLEMIGSEEE